MNKDKDESSWRPIDEYSDIKSVNLTRWSSGEWANALDPQTYYQLKRYSTYFYILGLIIYAVVLMVV